MQKSRVLQGSFKVLSSEDNSRALREFGFIARTALSQFYPRKDELGVNQGLLVLVRAGMVDGGLCRGLLMRAFTPRWVLSWGRMLYETRELGGSRGT